MKKSATTSSSEQGTLDVASIRKLLNQTKSTDTPVSEVLSARHNFSISDRVFVNSGTIKRFGKIKFIGATKFQPGIWIGVEFEAPAGKNDGSYLGTRYFQCKPLHGVFVRPGSCSKASTIAADEAPAEAVVALPVHTTAQPSTSNKRAQKQLVRNSSFTSEDGSMVSDLDSDNGRAVRTIAPRRTSVSNGKSPILKPKVLPTPIRASAAAGGGGRAGVRGAKAKEQSTSPNSKSSSVSVFAEKNKEGALEKEDGSSYDLQVPVIDSAFSFSYSSLGEEEDSPPRSRHLVPEHEDQYPPDDRSAAVVVRDKDNEYLDQPRINFDDEEGVVVKTITTTATTSTTACSSTIANTVASNNISDSTPNTSTSRATISTPTITRRSSFTRHDHGPPPGSPDRSTPRSVLKSSSDRPRSPVPPRVTFAFSGGEGEKEGGEATSSAAVSARVRNELEEKEGEEEEEEEEEEAMTARPGSGARRNGAASYSGETDSQSQLPQEQEQQNSDVATVIQLIMQSKQFTSRMENLVRTTVIKAVAIATTAPAMKVIDETKELVEHMEGMDKRLTALGATMNEITDGIAALKSEFRQILSSSLPSSTSLSSNLQASNENEANSSTSIRDVDKDGIRDVDEKDAKIQRLSKMLEYVATLSAHAREELLQEREEHAAHLVALKAGTKRSVV